MSLKRFQTFLTSFASSPVNKQRGGDNKNKRASSLGCGDGTGSKSVLCGLLTGKLPVCLSLTSPFSLSTRRTGLLPVQKHQRLCFILIEIVFPSLFLIPLYFCYYILIFYDYFCSAPSASVWGTSFYHLHLFPSSKFLKELARLPGVL